MIVDLKDRLLTEARASIENGDFDAAAPLLERVLRIGRHDTETVKYAHVNLAAHWFERGDPRSVEHFRAALELDPSDHRVRYCLGHAHLDREEFLDAVREFETALDHHPGNHEYLRSLGVALAASGRTPEALRRLRAAAKVCPDEPIVLKDLAQVLGTCGRYDEAVRLMRRAVALAPDEPFFNEVLEEIVHLSEAERLAREARPGAKRAARARRPRKV